MRIGNHDTHELADVLPVRESVIISLMESIRANGQRRPIVLLGTIEDGRILEGRHRAWACERLGIVPRVKVYDGPDDIDSLVQYVKDENIERRDLQQNERIAALDEFARLKRGAKKHNKRQPALLETAHDEELQRIKDDGCPELIAAVERNEIPKPLAAVIAQYEPEKQVEAIGKIKAEQGKPKRHKALTDEDKWLPPAQEKLTCRATCVRCSANVIEHRHGLRCARCGPLVQWSKG